MDPYARTCHAGHVTIRECVGCYEFRSEWISLPGAGVRDGTLRYDNVAFELATFLAVSGSVCKGQGHFTIR